MKAKKLMAIIADYVKRWKEVLGLGNWKIDEWYHQDPGDYFKSEDGGTSRAIVYADWRYMTADIHFNIPEMKKSLSIVDIERTVVHELSHILVNQMRNKGIDHEERVVTELTNAFLFLRDRMEQNGTIA